MLDRIGSLPYEDRLFVPDETENFSRRDASGATERDEFNGEGTGDDLGAHLLQDAAARGHRAAGRQQGVDDQHALSRAHAVDVHCKRVGPLPQP